MSNYDNMSDYDKLINLLESLNFKICVLDSEFKYDIVYNGAEYTFSFYPNTLGHIFIYNKFYGDMLDSEFMHPKTGIDMLNKEFRYVLRKQKIDKLL